MEKPEEAGGGGRQWLEEGARRQKYKKNDVTGVKACGIGFLQSVL